ncbi:MAG: putative toxin-antitoxin system toxin component, PIN family [bacterium]
MIYKIVLDTNVIFLALAFDKMVEEVFQSVIDNKDKYLAYRSLETQGELEEKLKSKKFLKYRNFSVEQISEVLEYYYENTVLVTSLFTVSKSRDPKDNKFLELAKTVQADYLITGDKDLLVLKEFEGCKILKPGEFLAI